VAFLRLLGGIFAAYLVYFLLIVAAFSEAVLVHVCGILVAVL